MKKQLMALCAVLALGLVPAFATAVETPGAQTPPVEGESTAPVVMVKAASTVVAVTSGEEGTTVEFQVHEAYSWVDGAGEKTPAPELAGQRIVAAATEKSRLFRNDAAVDFAELKPGMQVKALLVTDGQPVTPTCTYMVAEIYHSVPKPHPGTKFEQGFFPRLWHTRGQILGMDRIEDRNVLNLDVRKLENAPKRFSDEGSRLVHLDAYVIVPERVVITNAEGRRIAFADLDVDDRVKVVGKFLRPEKWMKDDSGEPTPTLLAKRIKVREHAEAR